MGGSEQDFLILSDDYDYPGYWVCFLNGLSV